MTQGSRGTDMPSFRDFSIRRKLNLIIMATSSLALMSACTAFLVHQLLALRDQTWNQLATAAGMIGANSTAALSFQDRKAAEETLRALRADTRILAASVYDKDGALFARYPASAPLDDFPPIAGRP